jgi:hypothetical protein
MIGQRTTLVSLSISVWRYHLDGDFLHARRDGTPDVMVWNLLDRQAGLRGQVTKYFSNEIIQRRVADETSLGHTGIPRHL